MTRGLIIGYGRAGQRHGRLLDEMGIEWKFYDKAVIPCAPDGRQSPRKFWSSDLVELLDESGKDFDFAVICTPPDLHLEQIRQCLDAGLSVLCEKPLCGLGQLAEAEALLDHPNASKVMVAYNFRYHPKLQHPQGLPDMLVCKQQRDNLPEWGLLLDHCSHDIDIIRSQAGALEITTASHSHRANYEWWCIDGETQGQRVSIEEWVGPFKERMARLAYPDNHIIDLDPDPVMYQAMWQAFLKGEYRPGLAEAIETQRLLERCKELSGG